MADLQDMLLFVNYHEQMFERNGRVVLPRNNRLKIMMTRNFANDSDCRRSL